MHALSITKAIMVGLLASAPLAAAFGVGDVVAFEKRHIGSLASYASRVVRAAVPEVLVEKRQAPDEFGPWDSTSDEFGSWVDKREPHHTEAQIAAKEAAAGSSGGNRHNNNNNNNKRHHTEAQIAAKEAAAGTSGGNRHNNNNNNNNKRHHTEAQIAAKEAAAAGGSSKHGH